MSKLIVLRDGNDVKNFPEVIGADLILSVKPCLTAVHAGFEDGKGNDPSLLAFAAAMLVVGRMHLDEIQLPKQKDAKVEEIITKVINYFAGKSLKPHTVKVTFYGSWYAYQELPIVEPGNPIVLMGGGTDSCGILAYYALKGLKPTGLYFEYGQAAKSDERKAIFDIAQHFNCSAVRIPLTLSNVRKALNKFENISMEGAFPARNWMFYILTLDRWSEFAGNEIAVSVFHGEFDDHHPDHSPITLQDYQNLIDAYLGANKCKVVVPMRELDKSDAVYWYKEKVEPKWPLDNTRSCYGMFHRIDGACTGCMNKFVSQAAAGYDMKKTQFYESKWKSTTGEKAGSRITATAATKYFHKYFKRALEGKNYDDKRNSEIMWVMRKYPPSHKNVQKELAELVNNNTARINMLVDMFESRIRTRDANKIEQSMNEARTKSLV